MKQLKINPRVVFLLFLFLLALLLRLFLIQTRAPGSDEIWALLLTRASFADIWLGTLAELHPPFYFLFLRASSQLMGLKFDIFSLRLVSSFFWILFSLGIYSLAQSLLGKRIAIIVLLSSLFFPSSLWLAVYARYYSLLCFFSVLALTFFVRFLKNGETKNLGYLVIISTLGIYTHYYFLLLILSFGLYLVWEKSARRFFKKWLSSFILILIFCLPLFVSFFVLPKPQAVGLANNLLKIPAVFLSYVTSFEEILFLYYHPSIFSYFLSLAGFLLILTLLVLGLGKLRSGLSFLFFLILVLPVIIAVLMSYIIKPVLGVNSFLVFLPVFLMILACGLDLALQRKRLLAVVFLVFVFGSLVLFFQSSAWSIVFTEPYNFIKKDLGEKDLVLHANIYTFLPARYHLSGALNFGAVPTPEAPQTEKALGYKIIPLKEVLVHKGKVWYFEPVFYNVAEAVNFKKQLDKNLILLKKREFITSQVNVYLYKSK